MYGYRVNITDKWGDDLCKIIREVELEWISVFTIAKSGFHHSEKKEQNKWVSTTMIDAKYASHSPDIHTKSPFKASPLLGRTTLLFIGPIFSQYAKLIWSRLILS